MTTMISQKSMGRHIIGTHNFVIHNIQEHYIKDPLIGNESFTNGRHITYDFFKWFPDFK